MAKNTELTVFSSVAKDVLLDSDDHVMDIKIRGPAYFLKQAFKEEGIDFELVTGPMLEVRMTRQPGGTERGFVPEQSLSEPRTVGATGVPNLLISTILDEYDLSTLENQDVHTHVFLDVQGYVRDRNNLGKKQKWNLDAKTASHVFCLKGTREEVNHLPDEILEAQKQKLLVVTDGSRGCTIFHRGEDIRITPKEKIKTSNTIGAGDTFFAYFTSQYLRTENARASAEAATKKTIRFLKLKK